MDKNRIAILVTGAAKRMGRAIAFALGQAGYAIALHYQSSKEQAQQTQVELQQQDIEVMLFQADLSELNQVKRLAGEVAQHFGARWLGVINNASQFPYDRADHFNWQQLVSLSQVNVAAPCELAQQLYLHCKQHQTEGVVVNLLDQKVDNLNPDFFSYTLTKAALKSATQMQAQQFGATVRVCGVSPGMSSPTEYMSESVYQNAKSLSPLKRTNTMDDVAQAVAFLVQARNITGSILHVDAGQHLYASNRDVFFEAGGSELV
jgi:NAD(P)-dependent dehydrogenase (short-subunit alcohol dehydrogenase family)